MLISCYEPENLIKHHNLIFSNNVNADKEAE